MTKEILNKQIYEMAFFLKGGNDAFLQKKLTFTCSENVLQKKR